MKLKKDLTAAQIEKNTAEWKNTAPQVENRIKVKARGLISQDKVKKSAIFTARLRRDDLEEFKKLAEQKRIPYQTLLGYVIHSYTTGILVDVSEVKKVFSKK